MSSPVQDLSVLHQRREQRLMLALALPALLVILLLIVLPVGWLAWQSIYHDGFTLENYRRIFSEDIYWRSFALTFRNQPAVTVMALLLGYPIAYAASIAPRDGASSSWRWWCCRSGPACWSAPMPGWRCCSAPASSTSSCASSM